MRIIKYRIKATGDYISTRELKERTKGVSYRQPYDDAVFDAMGVEPVYATNPPATNILKINSNIDPILIDGKLMQQWESIDRYSNEQVEEAKELLRTYVNQLRDEKLSAGIKHRFTSGAGTVRTRDEVDFRNIQANATVALAHISGGNPSAMMTFRDQEDVTHEMPASAMLQLGLAIAEFGQKIYSASWKKKDAIKASVSIAELRAVDLEIGWE